jgi:hypothetical protein
LESVFVRHAQLNGVQDAVFADRARLENAVMAGTYPEPFTNEND